VVLKRGIRGRIDVDFAGVKLWILIFFAEVAKINGLVAKINFKNKGVKKSFIKKTWIRKKSNEFEKLRGNK